VAIVDNGSGPDSIEVLKALEREEGVSVTKLVGNRGVGCALNVGIQLARELGYSWVLTMDQDSVIDGSMVRAFQVALNQNPEMVSLSPTRSAGAAVSTTVVSVVDYAITSGNMVHMKVQATSFTECQRLKCHTRVASP
jgi:glycosyltransferase involved in cell wall biosynthesis